MYTANILRRMIGIPLALPMIIILYFIITNHPLTKTPIKSFTAFLIITFIIVLIMIMTVIGFYYLTFKSFDEDNKI